MFGKDQYVVGMTQQVLKHLACKSYHPPKTYPYASQLIGLEPNLIFPGLLERVYPSLETLTETHRTTSALAILADIALPLFSRDHYPAGGKHLLPLLHLALPGIDTNDPTKTIAAAMFITSAIITVPVADLTRHGEHDVDLRYEGMDIDATDEAAEIPREEEDKLCKATTEQFEEWLPMFLRRVFTVVCVSATAPDVFLIILLSWKI